MKLASFVLATAALISSTPSMACDWVIENDATQLHYPLTNKVGLWQVPKDLTGPGIDCLYTNAFHGMREIFCRNGKDAPKWAVKAYMTQPAAVEIIDGPGDKSHTLTFMCKE